MSHSKNITRQVFKSPDRSLIGWASSLWLADKDRHLAFENDLKFNNLQFGCFEFEQGEFEPQKEHLGFGKDLVWSHDFKIHPRIAQTSRTREVQARDSNTSTTQSYAKVVQWLDSNKRCVDPWFRLLLIWVEIFARSEFKTEEICILIIYSNIQIVVAPLIITRILIIFW